MFAGHAGGRFVAMAVRIGKCLGLAAKTGIKT